MHSHDYDTDHGMVTFHHNGDYSGAVVISVTGDPLNEGAALRVPFDALKDFVGEYVRNLLVQRLEQASIDEVLESEW